MNKISPSSLKFLYSIILIGLFIFLLPYFLSTFIGTNTIAFIAKQKGKTLSVSSMRLRWLGPQTFENITYSDTDIDFRIDTFQTNLPLWHALSLRTLTKESLISQNTQVTLEKGHFTLHVPGYPQAILEDIEIQALTDVDKKTSQLSLQGISSQNNTKGTLSLIATFQEPSPAPTFKKTKLEDINTSVQWNFENISTIPLDQLISLFDPSFKGFIFDLLGTQVNFEGTLHLTHGQGPLQMSLSSSTTNISIPAFISTKEITLTSPLQGTFILPSRYTEYPFSYLLKGFFSEFTPNNPLSFYISNKGFLLPLTEHAFQDMTIEEGSVDLGLGKAKEGSLLHDFFQILELNLFGASKGAIDVWFSPTRFRFAQGNIYLNRTDMLFDNTYQICCWGRLDLNKHYMDIVTGLTASALENAYGISGLPSNYVLQVPIRGPFSQPKVHKTTATKKIIAFKVTDLAQNPNLPFFGSILKQLMKEDQKNVPPPLSPLPWEKEGIQQKKPKPHKKDSIEDLFKKFK